MGNTYSICFDSKTTSRGVNFEKDLTCVTFSPQMTNNVAFFRKNTTDQYVRLKETFFSITFTVDYGPQAIPVLGFFYREQDLDDLWLQENPEVSFLNLANGQLLVNNKSYAQCPVCESGAQVEVKVSLNSLHIKVTNSGKTMKEKEVEIAGLTNTVFGFVGALQTGRRPVKFQLLPSYSEPLQLLHEVDQLLDCTETTGFKECIGIIDVSPDGKTLSRTSSQQGNGYGLLNNIISSGIHWFKVKISCDFGASLCIGVARYPFRLSEEFIKDSMKHIYRHPGLFVWRSYQGLLYVDGEQQRKSAEALQWQNGSVTTIELIVNMEDRTVELLKNDMSKGIIFRDIPEVIQPVVCFYAAYQKTVQLVSYKTTKSAMTQPKILKDSSMIQTDMSIPSKVQFDCQKTYGLVSTTADGMSVYRGSNQSGNSFSMLNVNCEKNTKYHFSFVIENDQGASLCVGVSTVTYPQLLRTVSGGNIYSSPSLCVFRSFQGILYQNGKELTKHFEEYWMTGTLLEMVVDVDEMCATVQYSINGLDQGVAFSGLQPPLFPLVSFYAGMEKRVTLIHFGCEQKRPALLQKQPSPNRFSLRSNASVSASNVPIRMSGTSPNVCSRCSELCYSVVLPCKHSFLCANHLLEYVASKQPCEICNAKISRVWNILTFNRLN